MASILYQLTPAVSMRPETPPPALPSSAYQHSMMKMMALDYYLKVAALDYYRQQKPSRLPAGSIV
jgi:hypothetical protein